MVESNEFRLDSLIGIPILIVAVCICSVSSSIFAQGNADSSSLHNFARLSVKFDKHATGGETKVKGTNQLPGFSGYFVHVPAKCVGQIECPLVVILHGERSSGGQEMYRYLPMAEKYGMILLGPDAYKPDRWDLLRDLDKVKKEHVDGRIRVSEFESVDIPRIDSAIQFVLQQYAIDTSRIALIGFGTGGSYSFLLGLENPDIFNRLIISSPKVLFDIPDLRRPIPSVHFAVGVDEDTVSDNIFRVISKLREMGALIHVQIALRAGEFYPEEQTFLFERLNRSWSPSEKKYEYDPVPAIISTEIIEKLIAFQHNFKSARNSVFGSARWENQISAPLRVGSDSLYVTLTNIPALLNDYRARSRITSYLADVGLSEKEMMNYRLAVIAVRIAELSGGAIIVDPDSPLAKNLKFYKSNTELFDRLKRSGFWNTP